MGIARHAARARPGSAVLGRNHIFVVALGQRRSRRDGSAGQTPRPRRAHNYTFLVHLAWMGLPDGSEGEDEDGEEPDVPDDDPDIPDEDIPGILAGLDELLAVLANIHAE